MDFPLLSSLVLSLGLLSSFSSLLVQSLEQNDDRGDLSHRHRSPPPPSSLPPSPPPDHHHLAPVPPPRGKSYHSKWHGSGGSHTRKKHNLEKKVGLWFIGVAAGLQVCVVGFLVYKRRKLFKDRNL